MAKIAGGDYRWKWHGSYQQTSSDDPQTLQMREARMPAPRQLDGDQSPAHFFGKEFRRAREAANMSQGTFGTDVPCDVSTVSRIERGELAPSEAFLDAALRAFPELGVLVRFYRASGKWSAGSGPVPRWFEEWLRAEERAVSLRYWQPIIVPGLFQTADYARALLVSAQVDTSEQTIDALVAARLARRSVFDKPDPPDVVTVLDESVLRRLIGTPQVMYEQLSELADMAARPYVTIQVVPASVGATAGLGGPLNLASADGVPDVLHTDSVPEGHTTETRSIVRAAAVAFDHVRGDAHSRGQSRELILRLADELWKT